MGSISIKLFCIWNRAVRMILSVCVCGGGGGGVVGVLSKQGSFFYLTQIRLPSNLRRVERSHTQHIAPKFLIFFCICAVLFSLFSR